MEYNETWGIEYSRVTAFFDAQTDVLPTAEGRYRYGDAEIVLARLPDKQMGSLHFARTRSSRSAAKRMRTTYTGAFSCAFCPPADKIYTNFTLDDRMELQNRPKIWYNYTMSPITKRRGTRSAALLAPLRGVEPPTYRLGGGRSILLSYKGISDSFVILPQICRAVNQFFSTEGK